MRKITITISVLIGLLALAAGVHAGGNPPPALNSGFQLQNRSTTSVANISIVYYNAAGNPVETDTDTIPANASKAYYVPNVLGQPDGRYSVVVSSDQELFALVNQVTASGATPYVAATHSGLTAAETGSPLYFPWVVCGYYNYNSMVAIQNAGSAGTNITVEFYQSGQSTPTRTYTFNNVPPGGSVFLDMTATPYKTDLYGFFGSVIARSTGDTTPLAGVVNDTNPTGSFLRSYNAVLQGSRKLYAPQVTANYYGFSSGITLQNPNPTSVDATIKYYRSGETTPAVTQGVTIAANSARPIYLPNVLGMPANFNGTAVIEASAPIIGIANHDRVPPGPAASYNLIPEEKASTTLYMPQIVRAYYGFESGWQVYNIGPEDVTVTVTYLKTDGSQTIATHSIRANSAFTMYLGDARGAGLGTMFNGGGRIAVTSGNGKLVGIANFVAPSSGDNMQVYNAFAP